MGDDNPFGKNDKTERMPPGVHAGGPVGAGYGSSGYPKVPLPQGGYSPSGYATPSPAKAHVGVGGGPAPRDAASGPAAGAPASPDAASPPGASDAFGADAPTVEPATQRRPATEPAPGDEAPKTKLGEISAVIKGFVHRHEKMIWWLHTFYALGLGAFVATFAQKGLERARILAITGIAAWLLFLFFFKFFGTGAQQDFITAWPGARRRFFVMTYLLKNLFQGMLFFLLPFYYKTAGVGGPTSWFFYLVTACAILSTLDLVFDRILMRFKVMASLFYAVTFFGALNLVVPALVPQTSTLTTLMIASGLTAAAFWLFYVPMRSMTNRVPLALFAVCVGAAVGIGYFGRRAMPPVPMHVVRGGVANEIIDRADELPVEIASIREDALGALTASTEVQVMGNGDRLEHVWRIDGREVYRSPEPWPRPNDKPGVVEVRSIFRSHKHPERVLGTWTVDVETESGQIVGSVDFDVRP